MRNARDDIHAIPLPRRSVEETSLARIRIAVILKDLARIGENQEPAVEFDADNPNRPSLPTAIAPGFWFQALFDYV
jgi:hypothetical protein